MRILLFLSTFFMMELFGVPMVELGLVAIVAILSFLLAAGYFGAKIAPVIRQVKKTLRYYQQAISEDSPGGRKLTEEERQRLKEKALMVLSIAWEQYRETIIGRIFNRFTKDPEPDPNPH